MKLAVRMSVLTVIGALVSAVIYYSPFLSLGIPILFPVLILLCNPEGFLFRDVGMLFLLAFLSFAFFIGFGYGIARSTLDVTLPERLEPALYVLAIYTGAILPFYVLSLVTLRTKLRSVNAAFVGSLLTVFFTACALGMDAVYALPFMFFVTGGYIFQLYLWRPIRGMETSNIS